MNGVTRGTLAKRASGAGETSLDHSHAFTHQIHLNLTDELAKGAHGGLLSELPLVKPSVAKVLEDLASGTPG